MVELWLGWGFDKIISTYIFCSRGRLEMVQLLITNGADTHSRTGKIKYKWDFFAFEEILITMLLSFILKPQSRLVFHGVRSAGIFLVRIATSGRKSVTPR